LSVKYRDLGFGLVAAFVEDMMREVAEKVTAVRVPRTAHWILRKMRRISQRLW
jgi:hypothetical protein